MFKLLKQRKYTKLLKLDKNKKYPLLKELLVTANNVSFNSAPFTTKKGYVITSAYANAGDLILAIRNATNVLETKVQGDYVYNRLVEIEYRYDRWLLDSDGYKLDYLKFITTLINDIELFLNRMQRLDLIDITYYGGMMRPIVFDMIEILDLIVAMELGIPNDKRNWRSSSTR